ncbi:gamma carbonic anhydrase family protein [Balneolales bacterium ANBcel1]|nr:gamma carbonic anhydrase family protein [Balneolales bacterium ANBcel1]
MIYEFLNARPHFDESCFIAPSADIIGDVTLGSESSVWFNATLRGDVNYIEIGQRTNIQDNACIHVTNRTAPTRIGDQVTVGHSAVIHGCTIGDRVLVGIQSVVLDHAVIEPDCMLAAGSLVPPGKIMPSGYLCMGSPARPVRRLTDEERSSLVTYSDHYVTYMRAYQQKDTYEKNPFYDR